MKTNVKDLVLNNMPTGVYNHKNHKGCFQKGHKIWLGKKHTYETDN